MVSPRCLLYFATGLGRFVNKLWHLIPHEVRHATGIHADALHLHLGTEQLELGVELRLVDVVGDLVAAAEGLVDLVADVHEVGHLVLHALDLVEVDLAVLLLELLLRRLHRVHRGHHPGQVVLHRLRLLHVPHLALQLVPLRLVLLAALQDFQGLGLQGGLAGPLAHLGHLGLVGAELGVEGGDLHVEGGDPAVDCGDGAVERGFGRLGRAAKEAVHGGGTVRCEKDGWVG